MRHGFGPYRMTTHGDNKLGGDMNKESVLAKFGFNGPNPLRMYYKGCGNKSVHLQILAIL